MRGPSAKKTLAFFIFVASIISMYIVLIKRPKGRGTTKPWELLNEIRQLASPSSTSPQPTLDAVTATESPVVDKNRRAVLIFTEYEKSKFLKKLTSALESQRISYDILTWNKFDDSYLSLPRLLYRTGLQRYSGFIFDNVKIYDRLDSWTKSTLHEFCKSRDIGIVLLCAIDYKREMDYVKLKTLPLWVKYSMKGLYDVELNPRSAVLQITKADKVLKIQHRLKHTALWSNYSGFEPISYSYRDDTPVDKDFVLEDASDGSSHQGNVYRVNRSKFVTIMYDKGELDGVRRVFFGGRIDSLWMYRLIFLDSLSLLSNGALGRPLTQWMMVDIDDIFVAHKGTRMKKADVEELVMAQERISQKIENFRFNLGFSGYYFKRGSAEENEGDELLIKYRRKFWWFPHMYRHIKPHKAKSLQELVERMMKNKLFAEKHGILVNTSYAVSPHHSGVYPVHEELYKAWDMVWSIKVTSTEEYPHLYPQWKRRGFVYNGIKVLPRQTCGLFTQNIFFRSYPKGRHRLDKSINGGELFMTVIDNPVSVFMTHFGNYGNDRLALYTFEALAEFIHTWTNLRMVTVPPTEMAERYFELWPEDVMPIWQSPCADSRHLEIWSPNKSCSHLPKILIIGPQKTGTTALQAFMSLHPNLVTSLFSRPNFEEVQFFNNDTNYLRGLDWYMAYFPDRNSSKTVHYFEKSANYFDSSNGPLRISTLLPNAKIIFIAADPSLRAYSWYQHILSKKKKGEEFPTFYDLISQIHNDSILLQVRRRALVPGLYALHLERWLKYYSAKQILMVDSEILKKDPAKALNSIQKFLGLEYFDFKAHIAFNAHKGFFCPMSNSGKFRCLGIGKGRVYPHMDLKSERYLREFYRLPNLRFADLLKKNRMPLPSWLKRQMREVE